MLIYDFLFGGIAAALAGDAVALVLAGVWFGIPLVHRTRVRLRDS